VLLPVYAAIAAAIVFYLLVPVGGAFALRGQWRRFRDRVAGLGSVPRLRYRDLADARREGRARVGNFRLHGSIEAIEGADSIWVRGKEASALVDLSRSPLYVLEPAGGEASDEGSAGTVARLRWKSLSSLAEGTSIFVSGTLVLEGGRPLFVDEPDGTLLAVCHDGDEKRLTSRLIAGGRAQNEYWNYLTTLSMSLGLVAISAILLLAGVSTFPTLRALIFIAGLSPVLPLAPPGLAFFLLYRRFWRRALSARTTRDLIRLPMGNIRGSGSGAYFRRPPAKEIGLERAARISTQGGGKESAGTLTVFEPIDPEDPLVEVFAFEGDPETEALRAERDAFLYATASGLSLGLALLVNFALAFALWRAAQ
jgi:hypothetical protein